MNEQKRTVLAFGLILLVLYLWSSYFLPKPQTQPQIKKEESSSTATPSSSAPETKIPSTISAPLPTGREKAKESDRVRWVWTSAGGTLKEWKLKEFKVEKKKDSPDITLVPFRGSRANPLAWTFEVDGQMFEDDRMLYEERSDGLTLLSYELKLRPDLWIEKKYEWFPNSYDVVETVEISNRGTQTAKIKSTVSLFSGVEEPPKRFGQAGDPVKAIAFINDSTDRKELSDAMKGKPFPSGSIGWAGFDLTYFLMAALPEQGRWNEVLLNPLGSAEKPDGMQMKLSYPPLEVAPGGKETIRLRFFAGPKDLEVLSKVGSQLEKSIDLGSWLGVIARPMLQFLRMIYSYIPNYGIAILILTILVRLLIFPLTQMQSRSMKKMQKHKPEMDALKEKHGKDKEAYSRALMTYMKTHKINPAGGCLLILPQMPVFFALYRVLYHSIDLRHAPFMFWIQDLSAHDPYFVLPLLLGAAMFFQQRMTPMPGIDPSQQAMMKIMPVIFTGLMLFLPAGLSLYIFVSTLWGLGQQIWVQKSQAV